MNTKPVNIPLSQSCRKFFDRVAFEADRPRKYVIAELLEAIASGEFKVVKARKK